MLILYDGMWKRGDKWERGLRAEQKFIILARKKGFKVLRVPEVVDKYNHIDVILLPPKGNIPLSFDVKGMKKIHSNGKIQDSYIWIEFVNDYGFKGWIFGDMDFVSFEIMNPKEGFMIIPRFILENFVINYVKLLEKKYGGKVPITKYPQEATTKFYRRTNSKCLCLLLKRKLLEEYLREKNLIYYWFF